MTGEWSLLIGHRPEPLALALIVACVALALLDVVVLARRPPPSARGRVAGLVVLRLVAILGLLAVVFELDLRVRSYPESGRRVVVLVDRSLSMSIPDGPAGSEPGRETSRRWDRVVSLWDEGEAARERWRAAGVEIELRGFGERSETLSRTDVLPLDPDANGSDLARALSELGDDGEAVPIAAVVVISDGLVAPSAAAERHLEAVVDELGVPFSTVAAGGPTLRDVSLTRLHVGEFAFVENVTEFAADVVAHGLDGQRVEVSLTRDGQVVETQSLRVGADGSPTTVRFEVAPDRTGQFVYGFRIAEQTNEASVANNARSFVVKVLRDKVRVLHVAGRPDWDVRALRTLLKRDPNVELLSYYILRDWEDLSREDESAPLSLIAFPTDELFHEQLGSFDLIVMHNFDAQAHGDYLANIAEYVRQGGSLVVIGGDLGFATGDFNAPALASLLPVDMRGRVGLSREPFSPKLTEAGRRHPITAWLAASGRGDWNGLPALDSFNPTSLARDGAGSPDALLVHPDGAPLLAVSQPEKGRVVALTTGSSWRLGFAPDLPLIDGARPYDLLWLGTVRWLLRDESAERLVLETQKTDHHSGESVEFSMRTLSPSYAAEPDVDLMLEVRQLSEGGDGAVAASQPATTDAQGRASASIPDLPDGAYEAEARRIAGDEPPARRVFLIGAGTPELAELDADPGTHLLDRLSDRSGGDHQRAIEREGLPQDLPMAELDQLDRPATGRRDIPLWDGWWSVVLLVGCFGGEWVLRRRLGAR